MSSQWVRHISGQGEKWKVVNEYARLWDCTEAGKAGQNTIFYLPKSEYILCDPPEQWVDVTEKFYVNEGDGGLSHREHPDFIAWAKTLWGIRCYRLRKVRVYQTDGTGAKPNYEMAAFIVERKVHP